MRKGLLFCCLAAFTVLLSFCTEKKADDAACLADDPNPNKSSELAILMRGMATHAEQLKKEIADGKVSSAFPEEFRTLHTAVPTDSMIKGDAFDEFADGYLKNLELFYAAPDSERVTRFNAVVGTCISCHEQSCPGPIVRIKKMKIQ